MNTIVIVDSNSHEPVDAIYLQSDRLLTPLEIRPRLKEIIKNIQSDTWKISIPLEIKLEGEVQWKNVE